MDRMVNCYLQRVVKNEDSFYCLELWNQICEGNVKAKRVAVIATR